MISLHILNLNIKTLENKVIDLIAQKKSIECRIKNTQQWLKHKKHKLKEINK